MGKGDLRDPRVDLGALLPTLAAALLACGAHGLPPARPLPTAGERARAEDTFCRTGELPPWLDDGALAEAERADRYDAGAFDPAESFTQGSSGVHSPTLPVPRAPGAGGVSSRALRVMDERMALRQRCEAERKGRELELTPR